MTACVNKHTKRVAAVVTASLVGALSLGVAPVAAMATDSVDMLADPSDVWDGIDFTWSIEADPVNGYVIDSGDQFVLTGATDAFGNAVSMSDVQVFYFSQTGDTPAGTDMSVTDYSNPGSYFAIVVNSRVEPLPGSWSYSDFQSYYANANISDPVEFTVEAKSLDGAYAYEGDNVSDKSFKYTGIDKVVNFADAAGHTLKLGEDYKINQKSFTGNVNAAGTYTYVIEGLKDYKGSKAVIDVVVEKIDLSEDIVTIAPIQKVSGTESLYNGEGKLKQGGDAVQNHDVKIYVDGEEIAPGVLTIVTNRADKSDGTFELNGANYLGRVSATVTATAQAAAAAPAGSVENTCTVKYNVVDSLISNFYYDNDSVQNDDELVFETAKGEAFDPTRITAAKADGESSLPLTVTVTKDGEVVTDYSEPGVYKVQASVIVPDDLSYAGTVTFTVVVQGKHYNAEPEVFAAIDGKDAKGATIEYDGEAVEPVVVAKSGSATIDAADYTVTYTDEDGEAVESIVEPGEYTGTVDFGNATWGINGDNNNKVDIVTFTFKVTKAQLRSAKADKDVYDYTGEAVTPVFTAYNEGDLEGLSIAIDPAVTGVSYFEVQVDKKTGKPVECDDTHTVDNWHIDVDDDNKPDYELASTTPLKASDLTDEGYYVAQLTAPVDNAHFEGQVYSVPFQISEYAAFSDVDAGSWYADAVYNANDLGYMTGIKGTDLFMPLADISRAELSKVFFNMAGQSEEEGVYFPSAFADVDGWAWYAQPVAWASEAGIVTGYDADTFGPMDKASREQVAVMLYRYAKAQGKDVSVKDADAALAAYKDGDQVSDWAKTAMAWAVENGIFGVDTDELWANQNIQRAAVASIAVRFQPEALPEA